KIAQKYIRKEKLERPSQLNRVSLNIFFWQFNPVRNKKPQTPVLSSVGISNGVKNFEKTLEKRKELALFFQEKLKKIGFQTQESANNSFTFLSVLVPKGLERDKFVIELRKKGVFATRIWRTPLILNEEVQKEYKIDPSQFPITLEVAKRIVNFPLQNFYRENDIKKITKSIKEIIERLRQ
ncbi:MAG: DegT/DnrJ/EryC1/StrS family aminotransferase, partial [Patescibacteria group bacterium]|nr:DegT/DnrJ/EryC1/StrS family aminotransferase [Patescibacteria group bacterium]